MKKHIFGLPRPVRGQTPPDVVGLGTFQPLPKPTGSAPFHLDIKDILPVNLYNQIISSGEMIFHTVGDVGGVKNPADQALVADHMETQFDPNNPSQNPSFFYILGDVVYYYGQLKEYNNQFYEPYKFYPAPIFAIPGNHDGDIDPTDPQKPASLDAFVQLFCSKQPVVPPEAGDTSRTTMTQPNVYWVLVTPVANIIGLYTNVPEGGIVKADQQKWFINELINANKERSSKALIVTLHHPPYSMDNHHGASAAMEQLLDNAFTQANVFPDMVLTGHVHNYQRFTRQVSQKQIPYIVAGAGGYWNLHNINSGGQIIQTPAVTPFPNVTFEKYNEDRHGFLKIHIDMQLKQLSAEYYTVPQSHEPAKNPAVLFDSFKVDLVKNIVL